MHAEASAIFFCAVFNPAFADPVLDGADGDIKMPGNLIFVDIVCPDEVLDLVQKLLILTVWTQFLVIGFREASATYRTYSEIVE